MKRSLSRSQNSLSQRAQGSKEGPKAFSLSVPGVLLKTQSLVSGWGCPWALPRSRGLASPPAVTEGHCFPVTPQLPTTPGRRPLYSYPACKSRVPGLLSHSGSCTGLGGACYLQGAPTVSCWAACSLKAATGAELLASPEDPTSLDAGWGVAVFRSILQDPPPHPAGSEMGSWEVAGSRGTRLIHPGLRESGRTWLCTPLPGCPACQPPHFLQCTGAASAKPWSM